GDVIQPAREYVRRVVEQQLAGNLSPRMIEVPGEETLTLRLQPASLHHALWLQFAFAITGNKSYRRCPECQRWFELSPVLNRADRLFCSNACRTRAYRQRITRARDLRAQGVELEPIAQQLDTDVKTVEGW